jgi:hypothetical protein
MCCYFTFINNSTISLLFFHTLLSLLPTNLHSVQAISLVLPSIQFNFYAWCSSLHWYCFKIVCSPWHSVFFSLFFHLHPRTLVIWNHSHACCVSHDNQFQSQLYFLCMYHMHRQTDIHTYVHFSTIHLQAYFHSWTLSCNVLTNKKVWYCVHFIFIFLQYCSYE